MGKAHAEAGVLNIILWADRGLAERNRRSTALWLFVFKEGHISGVLPKMQFGVEKMRLRNVICLIVMGSKKMGG